MVGVRAGAGVVVALGTAVLLGVLGLSGPASGAPVNGTAGNGGAVIVVLKNQHSTGQFAALNASREGVVHADQSGVLAQVYAHGGTDVRQLVSVNAVAATLSASAVAALSIDPSVAEIVPDHFASGRVLLVMWRAGRSSGRSGPGCWRAWAWWHLSTRPCSTRSWHRHRLL